MKFGSFGYVWQQGSHTPPNISNGHRRRLRFALQGNNWPTNSQISLLLTSFTLFAKRSKLRKTLLLLSHNAPVHCRIGVWRPKGRRMRRLPTSPHLSLKWTNRTGLTSFFGNFPLAFETPQPYKKHDRYGTLHCRVCTKTTTSAAFRVWKFYLEKYNNLPLYIHNFIART